MSTYLWSVSAELPYLPNEKSGVQITLIFDDGSSLVYNENNKRTAKRLVHALLNAVLYPAYIEDTEIQSMIRLVADKVQQGVGYSWESVIRAIALKRHYCLNK